MVNKSRKKQRSPARTPNRGTKKANTNVSPNGGIERFFGSSPGATQTTERATTAVSTAAPPNSTDDSVDANTATPSPVAATVQRTKDKWDDDDDDDDDSDDGVLHYKDAEDPKVKTALKPPPAKDPIDDPLVVGVASPVIATPAPDEDDDDDEDELDIHQEAAAKKAADSLPPASGRVRWTEARVHSIPGRPSAQSRNPSQTARQESRLGMVSWPGSKQLTTHRFHSK